MIFGPRRLDFMKAILKAAFAAAISGAFVGYLLKKRLYQARLGRP
jgi:hypothetical protein